MNTFQQFNFVTIVNESVKFFWTMPASGLFKTSKCLIDDKKRKTNNNKKLGKSYTIVHLTVLFT